MLMNDILFSDQIKTTHHLTSTAAALSISKRYVVWPGLTKMTCCSESPSPELKNRLEFETCLTRFKTRFKNDFLDMDLGDSKS